MILSKNAASPAGSIPRELFSRSLGRSLLGVTRIWLTIFFAWWLVGAVGAGWAVLPGIILIGTMQYHLNVLGHDGLHFLLADSRRTNDLMCRWLLHGPQGAPLGSMRRNHLNHHTKFGQSADLDRQYYDLRRFASASELRVWLAGSLLGAMTIPIAFKLLGLNQPAVDEPARRTATLGNERRGLDWTAVAVSQGWIALAAWATTGWWFAWLLLWALPMLTVMMGLNSIRSCLEHANIESDEPALNTFNSNSIEAFFLCPFHMNFHAEHHLVPAVPWHQLPSLRRHMAELGLHGGVRILPSYFARVRELSSGLTVVRGSG